VVTRLAASLCAAKSPRRFYRCGAEYDVELPRLYPILDASCFPEPQYFAALKTWPLRGITLLQYRNSKAASARCSEHARPN